MVICSNAEQDSQTTINIEMLYLKEPGLHPIALLFRAIS